MVILVTKLTETSKSRVVINAGKVEYYESRGEVWIAPVGGSWEYKVSMDLADYNSWAWCLAKHGFVDWSEFKVKKISTSDEYGGQFIDGYIPY